ncbi:MAG: hypothetical protein ACE5H3_07850, partial [Planctomycetota bacterium]
MKPGRLLTGLSILLWALALFPPRSWSGREFLLVDASGSAGGLSTALERARAYPAVGTVFLFARELIPFSGEEPGRMEEGSSALGKALRLLRPRLRQGDRLTVLTDGRVTDELPPVPEWSGIPVRWETLPPRPRIAALDLPPSWPPGDLLHGTILLAEGDTAEGTLQVEARPPGCLEAVTSFPEGPGRLALTLRSSRAPESGLSLKFTWIQGPFRSEREAFLGPSGRVPFWSPSELLLRAAAGSRTLFPVARESARAESLQGLEGFPRNRLGEELDSGWVVILASPRAADWLELPAALRPFRPAPPAGETLVVLLDRSGSMAAGALDQAREAIRAWAGWWPESAPFQVIPFGAGAEEALDPRTAEGRIRLEGLTPFGPTLLGGVLGKLAASLEPGTRLVVLSDGHSPPPRAGWEALAVRLEEAGIEIHAVPAGEDADREILRALGGDLVPAGGDLFHRFAQGLEFSRVSGIGEAHPAASSLFTLPESSPRLGPRDRLQAAPGAEPLLLDSSGATVAAALRIGTGLLIGLAAKPALEWGEAFAPLCREFWGSPRLERSQGFLLLRGEGRAWQARLVRARGEAEWIPFDPQKVDLWKAGPFPGGSALEVRGPEGWTGRLPADRTGEEEGDPQAWKEWIRAHAEFGESGGGWRPWLVVVALLLSSLGIWLTLVDKGRAGGMGHG